jgi:putative transposase
LDHRQETYRRSGISVTYRDQQNELPAMKKELPELVQLGSQALQETLRRVDRAYQGFFRRLQSGETPGFPRFKSKRRFDSFCFPAPSGWKILSQGSRGGTLHISNLGTISMRGRSRIALARGERRTLTVQRKQEKWYAVIGIRYALDDLFRRPFAVRTGVGKREVLETGTKHGNPWSVFMVKSFGGEKTIITRSLPNWCIFSRSSPSNR